MFLTLEGISRRVNVFGKAGAHPSEAPFKCLHSSVGFWPYSQTLDSPGKACQGQTVTLACDELLKIMDTKSFKALAIVQYVEELKTERPLESNSQEENYN